MGFGQNLSPPFLTTHMSLVLPKPCFPVMDAEKVVPPFCKRWIERCARGYEKPKSVEVCQSKTDVVLSLGGFGRSQTGKN